MIEYEKLLEFCEKNGLIVEEYVLLQTIYTYQYEYNTKKDLIIKKYYSNQSGNLKWADIAQNLFDRGYIIILKPIINGSILIKNLTVTDKYQDMMFVKDKEDCWKEFVGFYPSTGVVGDTGKTFQNANTPKTGDKEKFYKDVLKDNNKERWNKIRFFMIDLFDVDIHDRPQTYASVNLTNFIAGFDQHLQNWEEDNKKEVKGNWNTNMI